MPFRKKLTLLAFVVACCFWKSALAHAGANNSSPSNQSGVTARLGLGLPWGDIGGVFSRQMTDVTWHTQLIEKLWQQARKEFLKAPQNSRYAEYLQTVEQEFRDTLNHCLRQAQPPQDQSGHTHAQFAVTQTRESLEALIGQVQQGSEEAKALQGVVYFIQLAQDELRAIAQDSNANAQFKAQWESVVEQAFRDHQAVLRDRAFSPDATAKDCYGYAMHLWTDKDCLKTDNGDIVKEHFFKAARDGHPDAALKLLEIHQYQVVSTDPGDVFFQLSQLQINDQSLFQIQPQVRTHFLARAILFKNKPALVHLNRKIREDIDQGVRRRPDDTRWQAWVDLRSDLEKLAKAEQTQAEMGELIQDEMDELIEEVNGMYKEKKKNGKKKLALLSRMDNFSESDSDEEDVDKDHICKAARDGHLNEALKLLKIHQYQVVSTDDPGDVFFRLSQLQSNGQSPFQPQVRTHFLARAILFKNKPALVHLNSKIREDIDQGVRRKPDDTRWQAWVALGTRLKELVTTDETQRQMQVLIDDVNGMYQEKSATRQLAQLSQFQFGDFPQSDSDEESAPPPALEQVKVLKDENERLAEALQQAQAMSEKLAQEKQALVTQLEIDTSERSQQAKQLQASQIQCQTLIEKIKAFQAELSQKKDELLQRQNSRKLTEQQLQQSHQRIAELEVQLERLQRQIESQAKAFCLPLSQLLRRG